MQDSTRLLLFGEAKIKTNILQLYLVALFNLIFSCTRVQRAPSSGKMCPSSPNLQTCCMVKSSYFLKNVLDQ
jgi:hypothetical protein